MYFALRHVCCRIWLDWNEKNNFLKVWSFMKLTIPQHSYSQSPKTTMNGPLCIAMENGILFSKLFRPSVRKNCSRDWEKLLKFEAKGREFAKKFEISITIYSNRETSVQFYNQNAFLTLIY